MKWLKMCLVTAAALLTFNVCEASHVIVASGFYAPSVMWVPAHWNRHGFWVPGHYVQYAGMMPGPYVMVVHHRHHCWGPVY